MIGNDDIRVLGRVEQCETVGGTFCRSCFEVVNVPGLILELSQHLSHEVHHLLCELGSVGVRYGDTQEVHATFVHPGNPDG